MGYRHSSPQRELVATGVKRCSTCNEVKSIDEYHRHPHGVGGLANECKVCSKLRTRTNYRKRIYNITDDEYAALLHKQKGVCAICKKKSTAKGRDGVTVRQLFVDHDHETAAVRGLLCLHCNSAIGHFNHDPALLQAAIEYLRQPRLM